MQNENEKEFELIRKEMISVKDCITKYLGYIFAGSGAAIYGLARMETPGNINSAEMAFVAFSVSIIISLVTLILFYKFYSHNRFAGYCKLLNHERFSFSRLDIPKDLKNSPLFAWEVVVGKLRCCDRDPELFDSLIDQSNIADMDKKQLTDHLNHIMKESSTTKRKILLFKKLIKKNETSSWGFPPLVTDICFAFAAGFVLAGYYLTFLIAKFSAALLIVLIIFSLVQILLGRI